MSVSDEQQRMNRGLGVETVICVRMERKTPRPRGVWRPGVWNPDKHGQAPGLRPAGHIAGLRAPLWAPRACWAAQASPVATPSWKHTSMLCHTRLRPAAPDSGLAAAQAPRPC